MTASDQKIRFLLQSEVNLIQRLAEVVEEARLEKDITISDYTRELIVSAINDLHEALDTIEGEIEECDYFDDEEDEDYDDYDDLDDYDEEDEYEDEE